MVFVPKEEVYSPPPPPAQYPDPTAMSILKKQRSQIKDLQKTLQELQQTPAVDQQMLQNYIALLNEKEQQQQQPVRVNMAEAVIAPAPVPSWWDKNKVNILIGIVIAIAVLFVNTGIFQWMKMNQLKAEIAKLSQHHDMMRGQSMMMETPFVPRRVSNEYVYTPTSAPVFMAPPNENSLIRDRLARLAGSMGKQ
jgi:hypothetical protein